MNALLGHMTNNLQLWRCTDAHESESHIVSTLCDSMVAFDCLSCTHAGFRHTSAAAPSNASAEVSLLLSAAELDPGMCTLQL